MAGSGRHGILERFPLQAQLRIEGLTHVSVGPLRVPLHTDADLARTPFFVVGAGRSGNTLLRRILMAHPDVGIPPESYVLRSTVRAFTRYNKRPWPQLVETVLGLFEAHPEWSTWHTDLAPLRATLADLPPDQRSYQAIIHAVYDHYLQTHVPGATRWGDKTPLNTLGLPVLMRAFPQAKWVLLQRDGRDAVASYLDAGIYASRRQAMQRWALSQRYAHKAERRLGPHRFFTVRYVDLVTEPDRLLAELQRFLGLDVVSKLHEKPPTTRLGDAERYRHHDNVMKPLSTKSIGRWRAHDAFRRPVPRWFKRALAASGYDPDVASTVRAQDPKARPSRT